MGKRKRGVAKLLCVLCLSSVSSVVKLRGKKVEKEITADILTTEPTERTAGRTQRVIQHGF